MELWIILVIVAQLFYAVAVIVDKYIVSTPELPRPAVYAFYVSILSTIAFVVMLPVSFSPLAQTFGAVQWPHSISNGIHIFGYSFLAGVFYVVGIIFLFTALRRADASDVIPVVGSASAVVAFFMGKFFFNDPLPESFYLGFVLLVIGTVLISHYRFHSRGLIISIMAGLLIGMNTMFVKMVFNETTFIDGYFWTRLGNVFAGSLLLLWPPVYYAVTRGETEPAKKASSLIMVSKAFTGVAALLILFSISLGSLPIINAMQGLQFVFLLVIASGCSFWMPLYFNEAEDDQGMFQKIVAIGIILTGFVTLFI